MVGLGTLQREDSDQRKKMMQQIQDLQRQLPPSTDKKASGPVVMDPDTIVRDEESEEEEDGEDSAPKEPDDLFFMKPDHEEVRTNEDPEA